MLSSIDLGMTDEITDQDVYTIWQWCFEIYLQYGIKIAFPANTDPKKTYQWRYALGIAKKFKEWELSEEASKLFIRIAVSHSKQKGTLKKGLAALHQNNLLDACYRIVLKQSKEQESIIDSLERMKAWYDNKIGSGDPLAVLTYRKSPRSLANLTQWFQSNSISDLFIALSKDCSKAVSRLNNSIDSQLLPKQTSLYMLRHEFSADAGNLNKISSIFQRDWRSQ